MKTIFAAILAALIWALPASASHLKPGSMGYVEVWCLSAEITYKVLTSKQFIPGCFTSPPFACIFIKYGKKLTGVDGRKWRIVSCKPLNPTVNQGRTVYGVEKAA